MQILETKEIAMILQEETKPFPKTTTETQEILEMRDIVVEFMVQKQEITALMERVDMQYSPIQNPRLSYRPQVITKEKPQM